MADSEQFNDVPLDSDQIEIELYQRQRAESDAVKITPSLEEEEESKLSENLKSNRAIESSLGAKDTEYASRSESAMSLQIESISM